MKSALIASTFMLAWSATATAANEPCELHLFALDYNNRPTPKGNLLVKPASPSGDPLAMINATNPYARMLDLTDDEYREALALPQDTPVFRHWDVPINGAIRKSVTPLVSTSSACHAELIGYSSSGFPANRTRSEKIEVKVNFVFREFVTGAPGPFVVRDEGFSAVDVEKGANRDAESLGLHAASVNIIKDFAKSIAKQRSKLR